MAIIEQLRHLVLVVANNLIVVMLELAVRSKFPASNDVNRLIVYRTIESLHLKTHLRGW